MSVSAQIFYDKLFVNKDDLFIFAPGGLSGEEIENYISLIEIDFSMSWEYDDETKYDLILFKDDSGSLVEQKHYNNVALEIAALFKLPDHFRSYTLRFEAMEWPIVTITQELTSAYENTEAIKEGIGVLKEKYKVETKKNGKWTVCKERK